MKEQRKLKWRGGDDESKTRWGRPGKKERRRNENEKKTNTEREIVHQALSPSLSGG